MLFAVGPLLYIYMKVTQYISINIYRVAWFQIPCCITFAKYNQIWSMKKASSGTSSNSFITSHILNASSLIFSLEYLESSISKCFMHFTFICKRTFLLVRNFSPWLHLDVAIFVQLYKIFYIRSGTLLRKRLNNPHAILLYVKNLGW